MPSIDANGIALNYRFDGPVDAPPVVMSNSLASNLAMWDWQMPALTDRYRVLRYDSRGHGGSAVPPGPYSIDLLVRDARALMLALGIPRAHFVGLSKGGSVGQLLAVTHPEMVRSLVLCDTTSFAGGPAVWQPRIAAATKGGMESVCDATLERWFTPAFRKNSPAEVDKVRQMILTTPAAGFVACSEALRDMNQTALLKRIAAPTLIMVGKDDPGTPVAHSEILHREIPGSRLLVLDDAAHFANVEQAERFNAALRDFLDRH